MGLLRFLIDLKWLLFRQERPIDFARALKIPRGNPVEAAKIIGKNQIIQMDIGQAREDTYFINIAAAGSFTELTYSVPSQLKTMFGYFGLFGKRC